MKTWIITAVASVAAIVSAHADYRCIERDLEAGLRKVCLAPAEYEGLQEEEIKATLVALANDPSVPNFVEDDEEEVAVTPVIASNQPSEGALSLLAKAFGQIAHGVQQCSVVRKRIFYDPYARRLYARTVCVERLVRHRAVLIPQVVTRVIPDPAIYAMWQRRHEIWHQRQLADAERLHAINMQRHQMLVQTRQQMLMQQRLTAPPPFYAPRPAPVRSAPLAPPLRSAYPQGGRYPVSAPGSYPRGGAYPMSRPGSYPRGR